MFLDASTKFIDLFAGIGGFHQALVQVGGCQCVYASDIDRYARQTYEANYGILPDGDITKVDAADIPAHDVLCGGFPCQAFSISRKRLISSWVKLPCCSVSKRSASPRIPYLITSAYPARSSR